MANATRTTPAGFWIVMLVVVLLFSALVFTRTGGGKAPTPPAFKNALSLAEARSVAAKEGKPVLVFATADWCGPCQTFKGSTLRDPGVVEAMRARTVPVYLDVDQARDDAQGLNIRSIPVLILLRDGREVGRMEGNRDVSTVLGWLKAGVEESGATPKG